MKEYRDHYFLKAKQENYPARSIYKLKEIDNRFHLFKKGLRVLDLGAAPGSWTLGAAERVGDSGLILSCDLQTTNTVFPSNVTFMQENVFEPSASFLAALRSLGPFHIVMSDMAPQTTGTKFTDQARSLDLCLEALALADLCLIKGGSFIVKVFMGPDTRQLVDAMRLRFSGVKTFKPKSSRAESKETFYIGTAYCPQAKEPANSEN